MEKKGGGGRVFWGAGEERGGRREGGGEGEGGGGGRFFRGDPRGGEKAAERLLARGLRGAGRGQGGQTSRVTCNTTVIEGALGRGRGGEVFGIWDSLRVTRSTPANGTGWGGGGRGGGGGGWGAPQKKRGGLL